MPREDAITVEGIIVEVIGAGLFRAELANGHRVLAHSSRKNREHVAGFGPGGRVQLEMSPYDMSKGRIRLEPSQAVGRDSSRPLEGARRADAQELRPEENAERF